MATYKVRNENTKFHAIEDSESFNNKENVVNTFRQGLASVLGFLHYTGLGMLAQFAINLIYQLRSEGVHHITQDQESWITSIFILPMAPVCISTGLAMQKIAKRHLLITASILEIIGWMIQYFLVETSVTAILIGRFVIGISMAIAAPIIPLYLAEVTNPKVRGFCISAVFMGLSVGIMFGNIVGGSLTWKTYILISTSMAITNFMLVCYLKESYVWHLKKTNVYKVKKSFYWYRGHNDKAILEVSKYISDHATNMTDQPQNSSFTSDFRANIKLLSLPLFVTVTLMTTMHLSGYKVVVFYSIGIIGAVLPNLNIYIATIIVDAIRIFAATLGCILVKRYPVRLLVMISGSGSAVSHVLFCVFKYYSYISEQVLPILSLVSLIMFIIFASIGLASLPWVVCGEIFPLKVKNIGCGISLFAYYIIFFLSIKYSPLLEVYFGLIGEFLCFACCTTIGTIIMYFTMPETKNRTLGEIEDSIKNNSH